MTDLSFAPWTDEEVRSLNAYQAAGVMHPFTCGNDSSHHLLQAPRLAGSARAATTGRTGRIRGWQTGRGGGRSPCCRSRLSGVTLMPDPWTTPGRPHATRYVCPLEDWYFDEPTEPPHFGIVGYKTRAKDTEAMIRQHLEEHTLDDWVKAATELLKLRQELECGPQARANRRHADADGWLKGITQVLNTVTGAMVTLPEPIDVHLRDIDRVIDEYQAKFLAEWEAQKDERAARTASMFGWEVPRG